MPPCETVDFDILSMSSRCKYTAFKDKTLTALLKSVSYIFSCDPFLALLICASQSRPPSTVFLLVYPPKQPEAIGAQLI